MHKQILTLMAAGLMLSGIGNAAAQDAAAAEGTLKKSNCVMCHAAKEKKAGPSFQSVAAKYKGKADAEQTLTKALTAGTPDHAATFKTKDAKEISNAVKWILAQ